MKAGIVIDPWKLEIFQRHLSQARYAFGIKPGSESHLITVQTDNLKALAGVVAAANCEAAKTGSPNQVAINKVVTKWGVSK